CSARARGRRLHPDRPRTNHAHDRLPPGGHQIRRPAALCPADCLRQLAPHPLRAISQECHCRSVPRSRTHHRRRSLVPLRLQRCQCGECGAGALARRALVRQRDSRSADALVRERILCSGNASGAAAGTAPARRPLSAKETHVARTPSSAKESCAAPTPPVPQPKAPAPATQPPLAPNVSSSSLASATQQRELQKAERAMAGALKGDWRDVKTLFEFAGIFPPKDNSSATDP